MGHRIRDCPFIRCEECNGVGHTREQCLTARRVPNILALQFSSATEPRAKVIRENPRSTAANQVPYEPLEEMRRNDIDGVGVFSVDADTLVIQGASRRVIVLLQDGTTYNETLISWHLNNVSVSRRYTIMGSALQVEPLLAAHGNRGQSIARATMYVLVTGEGLFSSEVRITFGGLNYGINWTPNRRQPRDYDVWLYTMGQINAIASIRSSNAPLFNPGEEAANYDVFVPERREDQRRGKTPRHGVLIEEMDSGDEDDANERQSPRQAVEWREEQSQGRAIARSSHQAQGTSAGGCGPTTQAAPSTAGKNVVTPEAIHNALREMYERMQAAKRAEVQRDISLTDRPSTARDVTVIVKTGSKDLRKPMHTAAICDTPLGSDKPKPFVTSAAAQAKTSGNDPSEPSTTTGIVLPMRRTASAKADTQEPSGERAMPRPASSMPMNYSTPESMERVMTELIGKGPSKRPAQALIRQKPCPKRFKKPEIVDLTEVEGSSSSEGSSCGDGTSGDSTEE